VVDLDDREDDLVRRDGDGPAEAGIVVEDLGDRRHGPTHPDAVRAHRGRPGVALGIQDRNAEGLGVAATQLEDVAGLDAADHLEGFAAGDTGLAVEDAAQVQPVVDGDVPFDIDAAQVDVVLVGAGGHP
jgi:hypothetical protein